MVEMCKDCIFKVVLNDGWMYCVLNGAWVGDKDYCSGFLSAIYFIEFITYYNKVKGE